MKLNILCIGDIVGKPGRQIVADKLQAMVEEHSIDCVIANSENAAGGSGLTRQIYDKLTSHGVNLITMGDHVFRKKDIIPILETQNNIARPANLSPNAAGKNFAFYQCSKGFTIGVISLIGRVFMKPAECPFNKMDEILTKLKQQCDIVIVDVHAEATSEKIALGHYLDGKVSLVFGTHTHVQTADEHILSKGTGYITDIGMTGSHHSVIGRRIENIIKAMRTQMPFPFEVATEDCRMSGIIACIDSNTKVTERIERFQILDSETIFSKYDSDDGHAESMGGF